MSEITSSEIHNKINSETLKENFVASLSHDLKNPTIAQIRILELLLKGKFGLINENQKEIIKMLLDSCRYMNAMLCSFLTTYRNEKGTIALANNRISINKLTAECYDEIIYLAEEKEIKTELINNTQNDIIYGDEIQIRRVIMNLLANGIKYAYKNSILNIRTFNDEHFVYFEYKNESPFMSKEKLERIFAKYISFTQAHETFGTGLGLYASKKIAEAHGGEIYVKSFKDNKNIFGFKIPYGTESLKKTKTVTF